MSLENNSKWKFAPIADTALRLGVLVLLLLWCIQITRPFISIFIWGLLIAITFYPLHLRFSKIMKGKSKLSSILLTIAFLLLLIAPVVWLGSSLVDGIQALSEMNYEEINIVPPPDKVAEWPLVGSSLYSIWESASTNLQALLLQYQDQIKSAALWLMDTLVGTSLGVLQFLLSIVIAGVLLNYAEAGETNARRIFVRIAGNQGEEFAEISVQTIRNVVKGVILVAAIQAFLVGAGLMIAGVPMAGLWALFALLLAIMQIGILPITLGAIVYMFYTADLGPAIILTIWLVLVSLMDNVLKPILMGKGSSVPMLVVFIGSLGGFMYSGFLGLFLGPVILSLAYKLYLYWLRDGEEAEEDAEVKETA